MHWGRGTERERKKRKIALIVYSSYLIDVGLFNFSVLSCIHFCIHMSFKKMCPFYPSCQIYWPKNVHNVFYYPYNICRICRVFPLSFLILVIYVFSLFFLTNIVTGLSFYLSCQITSFSLQHLYA